MARKKVAGGLTDITSIQVMAKGTEDLIPAFTQDKWFNNMPAEKQARVSEHAINLAKALVVGGAAKMIVGQELKALKDEAGKESTFKQIYKKFHLTRRSAYRYMKGVENAKGNLPEIALRAAMARGMNIMGDTEERPLGVYTAAVKQLPPPKNLTEDKANEWLDNVEKLRKEIRSKATAVEGEVIERETEDQTVLLKRAYRFYVLCLKKVPGNIRSKQKFAQQLAGLQFTEVGLKQDTTVSPVAIPQGFVAERGRPRLIQGEQPTAASA